MDNFVTFQQLCEILGERQSTVRSRFLTGDIPRPQRFGSVGLYTKEQVEEIKAFFEAYPVRPYKRYLNKKEAM